MACTVRELNQILHGLPKEEVAKIKQKRRTLKVEKILKGSLESIQSPSASVKIHINYGRESLLDV